MKHFASILALLVFALVPTWGQTPVNSLKDISATAETFTQALISSEEPPPLFIPSGDDQRTILKNVGRKFDEEAFDGSYQKKVRRIREKYRETRRGIGTIEQRISWDTVSYSFSGQRTLALSMVFRAQRWADQPSRDVRILVQFTVLGDRLLLDGTMHTTSALHYDLHVMETINQERQQVLYKKYRDYLFYSSEDNLVPFQQKGKWGLQSLDGVMKLPAEYDSIAKFKFDYYRVVSKKGHNLLDKNFKPFYKTPQKTIRITKTGYQLLNAKGQFEDVRKESMEMVEAVVEVEGPVLDEVAYTPQPQREKTLREKLSDEYYSKGPYQVSRESRGDFDRYTIRDEQNNVLSVFSGYQYLDSHHLYLAGRDSVQHTVVASYKGNLLLRTADAGKYISPGYELLYNRKTRLFGVYCPYTNLHIEPKYYYIEPIDRDRFFVVITQKGKIGYLDSKGKELF